MLYSVWNQGLRAYDYYETPGEMATVNAPKPHHLRQRSLGATPDQASWPLPPNARHVGRGPTAVGRVASPAAGRALGDVGAGTSALVTVGLLAFGGLLLWSRLRKPY